MHLFRLQKTDSQLDALHNRINEIERILSDKKEIDQASTSLDRAKRSHEDAQKRLRDAENLVQDQNQKIERNNSTLYSGTVKNPKELQDIQNEIASLKRYLVTLEESQLQEMLALEEAEKELEGATLALKDAQTRFQQQNSLLLGEKSTLEADIERLEQDKQVTLIHINEADLALYTTLRQQKRGLAVAAISDGACTGCGTTLTPALRQATLNMNQIVRCPGCGRILYSE